MLPNIGFLTQCNASSLRNYLRNETELCPFKYYVDITTNNPKLEQFYQYLSGS